MNARQWSTWARETTVAAQTAESADAAASILADVQTFTPDWGIGFGAGDEPSGDVSYLDLGDIVIMWTESSLTGDSDSTAMTWSLTAVPSAIRPSDSREVAILLVNSATSQMGSISVGSSGNAIFSVGVVSGTSVQMSTSGFANTGLKGITKGSVWVYPK